jgi:hypothetical protein
VRKKPIFINEYESPHSHFALFARLKRKKVMHACISILAFLPSRAKENDPCVQNRTALFFRRRQEELYARVHHHFAFLPARGEKIFLHTLITTLRFCLPLLKKKGMHARISLYA